MQKINISWDDWYDAYLAYKRCMDKDYKEEGDNNYDYAEAKKILEATVLNPHIIVDDELVGTSFDIIIDYAMCCVWCRDSEKALELAKMVQKYLHLEEIAFKKGTDTKAYTYTEESQRKMWIKLCKVYANCKKEESVEYLISAIDTMKSENVNVGAEFYRMIALACGRSGKYELALKYWEQALDLADSVLKGQMQRTDYPIFWQERMKAQDSRISYSKFWTREGRKLEPGMIIGTYLDEIDVNNNPHLVEVRDRGKGTSHVKIEIINFVIWKIERGMVYAFPLKVAKGRDLEVKSPVSIGDKQYVLSRDLCQIPADSTVIKDVCGTVGEELQQLLADVYRDIAVTPLDKRSTSKYIHKFMQEVTNERMVEKAKKGDRLILDDRKSCYYIVDLDEATKDYIVVPVTYKYDIRADVLFRIPFDSVSISAILPQTQEDKELIEQKLSNLPSEYPVKFCRYANKDYMIVGEGDNYYMCVSLRGCDERYTGIEKTVSLPKEWVSSYGVFDESRLEGAIRCYLNTTSSYSKKDKGMIK